MGRGVPLTTEATAYHAARKASAFRPGMDGAAPVSQGFALANWQAQAGVAGCSMYLRTTAMGAPPHEAAK